MARRISTEYWPCPNCGHENASDFDTALWEKRKPFWVYCFRCLRPHLVDPR